MLLSRGCVSVSPGAVPGISRKTVLNKSLIYKGLMLYQLYTKCSLLMTHLSKVVGHLFSILYSTLQTIDPLVRPCRVTKNPLYIRHLINKNMNLTRTHFSEKNKNKSSGSGSKRLFSALSILYNSTKEGATPQEQWVTFHITY